MKKIALLTSLLLIGQTLPTLADTHIGGIRIVGKNRIENETILSYTHLKPGETVSDEAINQAVKDLFMTGFFSDVKIHTEGDIVVIEVEENPIINRIAYEGNKKLRDDQIKEEIQLKPREILSRSKIQGAQQRILEMYRAMGRFAATVEPKVIKLDDNRADVVFEITEGETTYIRNINFVGNQRFSKVKLKDALVTKEYRFYRFFANDDTFDPSRFQADQAQLRQYYYDHGHPDFQQKSAVAEITSDYKDYHLTFTIDEGAAYTFGKTDLVSKIPAINADEYKPLILFNEGDEYSQKMIDRTIEKITDALGTRGFAFTEIEVKPTKNREKQTVDLTLEIKEGPKIYIERIEIRGNERTRDHVVRRELTIHEGDAYNTARIKKSERNLKDLGYFKNVEVLTEQGSSPDRAVMVVKVEEQSTGELAFSAGYSTVDGPLGSIRFVERNFMGKGQIVSSELSIAKKTQEFDVGFTEPYLFGRQLEGSVNAFVTRSTRFSAYTRVSQGITPSLGYKITEHLSQVFHYMIKHENISRISVNASDYIKQQKGSTYTSEIGQTLYYDRRDSKIDTTSGYVLSMSNSYAGLGGQVKYLKHIFAGTLYMSPVEDIVVALKGTYGTMQRAGKKIRIMDSFFLGADSFRGFEYGGVGPRDIRTGDALGGTRFWVSTIETLFPIGLPNEFGVKGALFSDFGTVWRSSEVGPFVRDNKYIRASWGVGLAWNSPFGPIRVDYSTPFRKDKLDDTQRFLISFRTKL